MSEAETANPYVTQVLILYHVLVMSLTRARVFTLFTYCVVNHRLKAWLLPWRVAHMWSSSTTLVQDLLTSSTGQSKCDLVTGIQHMRHGQWNVTCCVRSTAWRQQPYLVFPNNAISLLSVWETSSFITQKFPKHLFMSRKRVIVLNN